METSSRELNIKYAFVQAGYWMGFCVAFSFGVVMLQARGCSNAELGGIMAAGNICGFILSPMLAERLDSSKRLTVYHALWALQLFELVLLAAFVLIPGHGTAVAVIYTLYIAIEVCINPVNTQLYNLMELRGIHINYGLARGVGSLAFAAISAVLGILAGSLGAASLPVAGLVLCLFRCAALLAIQLRLRRGGNSDALPENGAKSEDSRSLIAFLRYKSRGSRAAARRRAAVLRAQHGVEFHDKRRAQRRRERDEHGSAQRLHGIDGDPDNVPVRPADAAGQMPRDPALRGNNVLGQGRGLRARAEYARAVRRVCTAIAVLCASDPRKRQIRQPVYRPGGLRKGAGAHRRYDQPRLDIRKLRRRDAL